MRSILCLIASVCLCAPLVGLEFPPMDKEPPAVKEGVATGDIKALNKKKGCVEIETSDGTLVFAPHWKGGMPKDGGGLDQATIEAVRELTVGDRVMIAWVWEERKRIESIKPAEKAAK